MATFSRNYLGLPTPVEIFSKRNTAIFPPPILLWVNEMQFALEYVSLQSDRANEEAEEWNQQQQSLKGDKEALRAKRLVELAIKHDQTGEIGGEIDVAILRKNG